MIFFLKKSRFSRDHRMLVEPACGAVLSALYEYKRLEIEGIYDILSHEI